MKKYMQKQKLIIKKLCGILLLMCVMMLALALECHQGMSMPAKAENIEQVTAEMTQEQEDDYYRSMGYEPVRKLGDFFKEFTYEEQMTIKGMVLLNDIDCATDTSWHEYVDNWEETGYRAPSLRFFAINGMGHKILNGENLLYKSKITSTIYRKITVLLGNVKGVENLYLENCAVSTYPEEYLLNVHVRSANGKNIVNAYGLSFTAPKIIKNCSVEGTFEYDALDNKEIITGGTTMAGIVISGSNTTIENSYFYGRIIFNAKSSESCIGGLIGYNSDGGFKLKNCYSYFSLDMIGGDNTSVGLIAGRQYKEYWSSTQEKYLSCVYEYDAVYAGNSGDIKEVGAQIDNRLNYNTLGTNCDIEEIKTIPAALLGDKNTVTELDFEKVWNLGDKDNHPTLRTLSVSVLDNTISTEKLEEKYNCNYTEQYYNIGDKFELSYETTDPIIGLVSFELNGEDALDKLSEGKLTLDIEQNNVIVYQIGYRPRVEIIGTFRGKDPYRYDDVTSHIEVEVTDAIQGDRLYYALSDKIRVKFVVEEGYHIKEIINLPEGAIKISDTEYEIPVGKVMPTERERFFCSIQVDTAKDFPVVGLVVGIVAGVAVIVAIVLIIVFAKKKKQKKQA